MLVVAFAGWLTFEYIKGKYSARAAEFDLSQIEQMESASVLYDRGGEIFGQIFIQNRRPIPYDAMPLNLIDAVIAAEDNRFYSHKGVDYMGIVRAALANYRAGEITQGASTVTQQLARNSFELRERTYKRKLVEIYRAERIEEVYDKQKIMELYLNRVYFGGGLYGAEAAARGYFGVPARDMTIGQSAMLAGLLKSPNGLSPWNDPEAAKNARNFVLKRMRELGLISRSQYEQASSAPLIVRRRTNPFKVSYAVDYVRQQAIKALGYDKAMLGGYRIHTTLDNEMQRAAEHAVKDRLRRFEAMPDYEHETFDDFDARFRELTKDLAPGLAVPNAPTPEYLQAAVVAYQNDTGGILTMVGGRDFEHSEYDRAYMAKRPSGTAFTPLVLAAAVENGMYPGQIVQDSALDNRYVGIGGSSGILGEWGVEQAENEYEGGIPAREAIVRGKNAATMRIGFEMGLEPLHEFAAKVGIETELRDFNNAFLGASEVPLTELTLAYTAFPNGGKRPREPFIIERIEDAEGKVLVDAVSPATAYQVHTALEEALSIGTGSVGYKEYGLKDFPAGGKTGTAYDFEGALFVGYDSEVTCGVWVGFDKPKRIFRGAFGKDLALPIWIDVMHASLDDFPPQRFERPNDLREVIVSRSTGFLADSELSSAAAKAMGIKEDPSNVYRGYATEEQIQRLREKTTLAFKKQYDEEEWPRAASAVDLATVRPIDVKSPPLIGFHDVYQAVRPIAYSIDTDDLPVMRAIPLDGEGASIDEATEAAAVAAAATAAPDREVRRAEAVRPLDIPTEGVTLQMQKPEPIEFD